MVYAAHQRSLSVPYLVGCRVGLLPKCASREENEHEKALGSASAPVGGRRIGSGSGRCCDGLRLRGGHRHKQHLHRLSAGRLYQQRRDRGSAVRNRVRTTRFRSVGARPARRASRATREQRARRVLPARPARKGRRATPEPTGAQGQTGPKATPASTDRRHERQGRDRTARTAQMARVWSGRRARFPTTRRGRCR